MRNKKENKVLTDIIILNTRKILFRCSELVLANKTGLTFRIKKTSFDFSQRETQNFLNLPVELFLSQYEIPFFGEIDFIQDIDKYFLEVKIRFMSETPFYYRECLGELLN
ncbi:MAG: hypothetical protein GDA46_00410 [Bdellovibrionales bacterium]|nr:hypothetical protein [Bdellovibrionales bacterium]